MKSFSQYLSEKNCPLFSYSDISDLEKFADGLLNKFGLDIEFTKHFKDRMEDERNNPCISLDELRGLFIKISQDAGKKIKKAKKENEAVLLDMQSKLNLPFVIDIDSAGKLELTMKTIMRKKNFMTRDKKVVY